MDEVSWTPVDTLSRILVELVLQTSKTETAWTKYYHLENPNTCQWSSLVPVIQQYFSRSPSINGEITTGELKAVSLDSWIKALEESGGQKEMDISKNPALKLLRFYEELAKTSGHTVKLDTSETKRGSETLKSLKAVNEGWMRLWLEQWNF